MIAVLLIGGLATRLLPLSRQLPKSLLPICDRELLHYQIVQLAQAGVNRIVLAAGNQVEQLRDYVQGYQGGLEFSFSIEPEPRGTAGALAQARDQIGLEQAIVLNADILSNVDLKAVIAAHKQAKRMATLVGFKVTNPARYGLLQLAGQDITGYIEKPPTQSLSVAPFINAGIYVLEPEVIASIPTGRSVSIEREVFPQLITEHGVLNHFPHEEFWYDVGTFESYFAASFALLAARYTRGEFSLWGTRDDYAVFKDLIYISKSAQLGAKVDLYHRVIVMREARIEESCRLQNCILMPGAQVGANVKLTDCIIGPGAQVESNQELEHSIIIAGEERAPFYPEAVATG
jgi:mannose-1-phosphate guanylyltransferase